MRCAQHHRRVVVVREVHNPQLHARPKCVFVYRSRPDITITLSTVPVECWHLSLTHPSPTYPHFCVHSNMHRTTQLPMLMPIMPYHALCVWVLCVAQFCTEPSHKSMSDESPNRWATSDGSLLVDHSCAHWFLEWQSEPHLRIEPRVELRKRVELRIVARISWNLTMKVLSYFWDCVAEEILFIFELMKGEFKHCSFLN